MEDILTIGTDEEKMIGEEVTDFELKAEFMVIKTNDDYTKACEMTKELKRIQKKVEEYWEPMRKSTYDAYSRVNAHKKEMLEPCKNAEKILKGKITNYTMEQERIRLAREAELRALAEAEKEKKIQEAIEADNNGDAFGAEFALVEAEVIDNAISNGLVKEDVQKVKGISKTKAWKITGIDLDKVPSEIMGMVIRPVDEKAVMDLIKMSKGKIVIPGIKYEETFNISVRA